MEELEVMASDKDSGEKAIFTVNDFKALQEIIGDLVRVSIWPCNTTNQYVTRFAIIVQRTESVQ